MANEEVLAKLVIQIVAELATLKQQMSDMGRQFKDSTAQASGWATSMESAVQKAKAKWMEFYAQIQIIKGALDKAFQWGEFGAKALQIEESFGNVTKSLGIDGANMITQMKELGAVFVEETGLMVKAQRLLAEGMTSTQIIKMMESARVAARLMGIDVKSAFDMIADAIITGRTRSLRRAFPTLADEGAVIKKTFGEQAGYITDSGKRLAIYNEVVNQTQSRIKELGMTFDELKPYEQFQKMTSAAEKLKEELAQQLLPAWQKVSDLLQQIKKDRMAAAEAWVTTGKEPDWFTKFFMGGAYEEAKAKQPQPWIVKGKVPPMEATAGEIKETENRDKVKRKLVETERIEADLAAFREAYLMKEAKLTSDGNIVIEDRVKVLEGERKAAIAVLEAELLKDKPKAMDRAAIERYYARAIEEEKAKIQREYEVKRKEAYADYVKAEAEIAKSGLDVQYQNELLKRKEISDDTTMIDRAHEIAKAKMGYENTVKIATADRDAALASARTRGEDVTAINQISLDAQMVAWVLYQKRLTEILIDAATQRAIAERQAQQTIFERGGGAYVPTGGLVPYEAPPPAGSIEGAESALRSEERQRQANLLAAQYKGEISGIMGNWVGVKNAEIGALDAQLAILKAQAEFNYLTLEEQKIVEQIYEDRKKEIAAYRDLNASELMRLGLIASELTATEELARAYTNVLPEGVKAAGSTFKSAFIDSVKGELKSFGDYWKGFWDKMLGIFGNIVEKMVEKWITELLVGTGAGGAGGLGGLFGMIAGLFGGGGGGLGGGGAEDWGEYGAGGGRVGYLQRGGPIGTDRVPIWGTPGEFMEPVPAVQYYGEDFMQGLRTRSIPKELLGVGASRSAAPGTTNKVSVSVSIPNPRLAAHLQTAIESATLKALKEYGG